MSIATVKAVINGQTYTLTRNASTGKYEATITAPGQSSYHQTGHYYNVSVSATDDAGNSVTKDAGDSTLGSSLQLRVIEKVAPVIVITSPSAGATITNNKPTISFKVTDDDSGVDAASITVSVDNGAAISDFTKTAIEGGYQCTYTPTTALADGAHTITVNAADNDGNLADVATVNIKVDTVPPTLNLTSPTDGLITNQSTVTVAGTTNDVTSSPVTLTVNGETVTVNADGSFSTTVSLTEGENIITVVATDAAGKSSTVTRTVTLDTGMPVFNSVTITPNPVDAGKTFIISVDVTDG